MWSGIVVPIYNGMGIVCLYHTVWEWSISLFTGFSFHNKGIDELTYKHNVITGFKENVFAV